MVIVAEKNKNDTLFSGIVVKNSSVINHSLNIVV